MPGPIGYALTVAAGIRGFGVNRAGDQLDQGVHQLLQVGRQPAVVDGDGGKAGQCLQIVDAMRGLQFTGTFATGQHQHPKQFLRIQMQRQHHQLAGATAAECLQGRMQERVVGRDAQSLLLQTLL